MNICATNLRMDMVNVADGLPVVHYSNKLTTCLAMKALRKSLTTGEQLHICMSRLENFKPRDWISMRTASPCPNLGARRRTHKPVSETSLATLEGQFHLVKDSGLPLPPTDPVPMGNPTPACTDGLSRAS